ncbi:hypothetical protein NQZ68_041896 [Dissostichus eleginoides]|nr:hypothetical protein NQZ68_041896 [Dissostichus eleginoides]
MDAREETLSILNNIWVKLQGLPNATPIDLGAFFVIVTFICDGVHLNGSADLGDLLLLLLSQTQDEGIYSLSNRAPHKELRMVQNGLKTQQQVFSTACESLKNP